MEEGECMQNFSVNELWESYRKACIPVNAHPVQLKECKRAFYSGIIGYHSMVECLSELPQNIGEQYLNKFCTEMELFHNDLIKGKV